MSPFDIKYTGTNSKFCQTNRINDNDRFDANYIWNVNIENTNVIMHKMMKLML